MGAPDTKKLLDQINKDVNKYLRYEKKATGYSKAAQKLRVSIFLALDKIEKGDFALYKEKIDRISKRLNHN